MIVTILLVIALVCFIVAASGYPVAHVNAGWLGAAFVVLSLLIPGLH